MATKTTHDVLQGELCSNNPIEMRYQGLGIYTACTTHLMMVEAMHDAQVLDLGTWWQETATEPARYVLTSTELAIIYASENRCFSGR